MWPVIAFTTPKSLPTRCAHHLIGLNLLLLGGAANGAQCPPTEAADRDHRSDSSSQKNRQLFSDFHVRKLAHSLLLSSCHAWLWGRSPVSHSLSYAFY